MVMEVKKRIALELQSKKPAELSELVLDNCRAGEDGRLEGLTEELSGLRSLSLINMGLRTLEHLPRLPCLELLDLSDNRISNGLEFLAEKTPKLTHLSLGGNRVKELCVLEVLKNLRQLQRLELMGCEVANLTGIRESVFEILPHLVYLDGADRLGALEPDSEDGDDDGDKCDEDDLDASESEVEDEEEEGEICEKDFLPDNEEEEEEEEEEGELEDADEEDEGELEEEEDEDEDEEGELEEDEDEENKHVEENKNDEDKHVVSEQSRRGRKRKHDDCEGENDGPSEKVLQVRLRNPNSGDLHD